MTADDPCIHLAPPEFAKLVGVDVPAVENDGANLARVAGDATVGPNSPSASA